MIKPIGFVYTVDGFGPLEIIDYDGFLAVGDMIGEEMKAVYAIPEGYALVPIKEVLKDGAAAQKAFWHALEFCNDPEDRNIRSYWESYKELIKSKEDLT